MAKRSRGKADSIQKSVDEAAKKAGIGIIACSQYASLGFDRIYLWEGGLWIVELKSSPKAKLTEQEVSRQKQCIRFNVPYLVIHSPEELLASLGIKRDLT